MISLGKSFVLLFVISVAQACVLSCNHFGFTLPWLVSFFSCNWLIIFFAMVCDINCNDYPFLLQCLMIKLAMVNTIS